MESKTKKTEAKEPFSKFFLGKVVPSILMCAWVYVALVATQYLVAFPFVKIVGVNRATDPLWTTVYSAIVYILALVFTILAPILAHKLFNIYRKKHEKKFKGYLEKSPTVSRERMGLNGLPTFTDIFLSIAGFIAFMIIASIVMFVVEKIFPWFDAGQAQDVGFSKDLIQISDRIVAFFALVIIAPIFEELIFRGWLYGKIRARIGIIPAMLLVSVLFGILHGQWNVGVAVFVLSLVLCAQRELTGTIYSGILLHMIKNGVAFYLIYIL
ncbi:MAG: CPBP family intramembrane metalloprotease [Candidatus Saccharibacteria bacterium]|nr:CPBP family intramembrane metalloprotease [Candidatus Saccharibacteria bacterium]